MPKITKGGVSDVRVDESYIAPPGADPATAIEIGTPDAGAPIEEEKEEKPSPGKTSSPDSKKPAKSTPGRSSGGKSPSTAPNITGR